MLDNNPFSLKDKTILITGASSGIGRSIAIECSKMGASVIITARSEERLRETLQEMRGDGHKMIIADLSIDADIDMLAEVMPNIDGITHCAGFTIPKPFNFISKNDFDAVMKVNFSTPVFLTQKLLKSKKINKGSSIVFISSISGVYVSSVAGSLYSASKGAVNGIVKGMAIELAAKHIRVNSVNPGMIETNILSAGTITEQQLTEDKKKYPLKRYGKPEEVAYAVIYLLSDASSWTTGSNILIDGGYTLL